MRKEQISDICFTAPCGSSFDLSHRVAVWRVSGHNIEFAALSAAKDYIRRCYASALAAKLDRVAVYGFAESDTNHCCRAVYVK